MKFTRANQHGNTDNKTDEKGLCLVKIFLAVPGTPGPQYLKGNVARVLRIAGARVSDVAKAIELALFCEE